MKTSEKTLELCRSIEAAGAWQPLRKWSLMAREIRCDTLALELKSSGGLAPNVSQQILETFVHVLNEALEADSEAMDRLFTFRTPCNNELEKHPTIQVGASADSPGSTVSILGLINGLLEASTGERIAGYFCGPAGQRGVLIGFEKYQRPAPPFVDQGEPGPGI